MDWQAQLVLTLTVFVILSLSCQAEDTACPPGCRCGVGQAACRKPYNGTQPLPNHTTKLELHTVDPIVLRALVQSVPQLKHLMLNRPEGFTSENDSTAQPDYEQRMMTVEELHDLQKGVIGLASLETLVMNEKALECSCDLLSLAEAAYGNGVDLYHVIKLLMSQSCRQEGLDLDLHSPLELLLLCSSRSSYQLKPFQSKPALLQPKESQLLSAEEKVSEIPGPSSHIRVRRAGEKKPKRGRRKKGKGKRRNRGKTWKGGQRRKGRKRTKGRKKGGEKPTNILTKEKSVNPGTRDVRLKVERNERESQPKEIEIKPVKPGRGKPRRGGKGQRKIKRRRKWRGKRKGKGRKRSKGRRRVKRRSRGKGKQPVIAMEDKEREREEEPATEETGVAGDKREPVEKIGTGNKIKKKNKKAMKELDQAEMPTKIPGSENSRKGKTKTPKKWKGKTKGIGKKKGTPPVIATEKEEAGTEEKPVNPEAVLEEAEAEPDAKETMPEELEIQPVEQEPVKPREKKPGRGGKGKKKRKGRKKGIRRQKGKGKRPFIVMEEEEAGTEEKLVNPETIEPMEEPVEMETKPEETEIEVVEQEPVIPGGKKLAKRRKGKKKGQGRKRGKGKKGGRKPPAVVIEEGEKEIEETAVNAETGEEGPMAEPVEMETKPEETEIELVEQEPGGEKPKKGRKGKKKGQGRKRGKGKKGGRKPPAVVIEEGEKEIEETAVNAETGVEGPMEEPVEMETKPEELEIELVEQELGGKKPAKGRKGKKKGQGRKRGKGKKGGRKPPAVVIEEGEPETEETAVNAEKGEVGPMEEPVETEMKPEEMETELVEQEQGGEKPTKGRKGKKKGQGRKRGKGKKGGRKPPAVVIEEGEKETEETAVNAETGEEGPMAEPVEMETKPEETELELVEQEPVIQGGKKPAKRGKGKKKGQGRKRGKGKKEGRKPPAVVIEEGEKETEETAVNAEKGEEGPMEEPVEMETKPEETELELVEQEPVIQGGKKPAKRGKGKKKGQGRKRGKGKKGGRKPPAVVIEEEEPETEETAVNAEKGEVGPMEEPVETEMKPEETETELVEQEPLIPGGEKPAKRGKGKKNRKGRKRGKGKKGGRKPPAVVIEEGEKEIEETAVNAETGEEGPMEEPVEMETKPEETELELVEQEPVIPGGEKPAKRGKGKKKRKGRKRGKGKKGGRKPPAVVIEEGEPETEETAVNAETGEEGPMEEPVEMETKPEETEIELVEQEPVTPGGKKPSKRRKGKKKGNRRKMRKGRKKGGQKQRAIVVNEEEPVKQEKPGAAEIGVIGAKVEPMEIQETKLAEAMRELDQTEIPFETEPLEPEMKLEEAETEPLWPETDLVEAETEPFEPDTEIFEAETELLEPETELVEAETELLEPETELLEAETELFEPETELVEEAEPLEPETELAEEAEPLEPETELVEAETEPLEPETELVEAETEPLEPETELVEAETEPLEPETERMEVNIESEEELFEPKTEVAEIDEKLMKELRDLLEATKMDLPVDINDPYDLGLLLRHLRHHSTLLAHIGDPDVKKEVLSAMNEKDETEFL
ncbi:titin-like isoform X2 [Acanthaster planci]|uniref:Titin-like isoform X2 n=1 Tax=Acanthaster planci TaxID=133434 RepID=A0A8B7Z2N6_ACAPL|nr:titin-like isoform X2 [Acanthaster planci]